VPAEGQLDENSSKAPSPLRFAGALQRKRFCRTVTIKRRTLNWRVSHVLKMNLPSLRSFAGTAPESSTLRTDSFAIAARRKTPPRKLF